MYGALVSSRVQGGFAHLKTPVFTEKRQILVEDLPSLIRDLIMDHRGGPPGKPLLLCI